MTASRAVQGLIHARDRVLKNTQRKTTTVCGMKVYVDRTRFAPAINSVKESDITCVGCKAILRERENEAAR